MNNRLKILNVWVDPVDMDQALSRIGKFIEKGDRCHSVFAVNPEKNFSVPKDPVLYKTFRSADLLIPDGIGIVLAVRILYNLRLSRVPGVELMNNICKLSAQKGYKIFIYGAREGVSKSSVELLQNNYPGLKIVGRANGYVKETEMDDLIGKINVSEADILFLALGSPRQERWFASHGNSLKTIRVCQGIGGTLDTITGAVKRAPEIWQKIGLEWFYRLISEPKRIKRQRVLPLFAAMVIISRMKSLFTLPGENF